MSDDTPAARGGAALDAELARYGPRSVTARLCDGLLEALPGTPDLVPYPSLEEVLQARGVDAAIGARARSLAEEPSVDRALFAAKSIDTGDTGITILTGVRSALSLFLGDKGPGAGADAQQRADAALKALGVAYLATQLLPREPRSRVGILRELPAGRSLILYYAAVEVAVPFGPEVASGHFVADLVAEQSRRIAGRLLGVIGRKGLSDAQETLEALTGELDRAVVRVAPHAGEVADTLRGILPKMFGAKAAALSDVVAAGADALPVYRYLTARLAVDTRIGLATWEADPEAEPAPVPEVPEAPVDAPADEVPANDAAATAPPAAAPPPVIPAHLAGNTLGSAGLQPVDLLHEPAAEAPEPEQPATEDPPGEHDLSGVYQRETPWGVLWLVFTREGVFSNHPPAHPEADWVAHGEAGHQVGTYQHRGDQLEIRWPGGRTTTSTFTREPTAMVVDGERCGRCDWNLDGHAIHGSYEARDGDGRWSFHTDGRFEGPAGAGRYTLGVGAMALAAADGEPVIHSLYSTLEPDSGAPATLWIGGEPFDRTGDAGA